MADKISTEQKNIQAGGDVAAGNIYKTYIQSNETAIYIKKLEKQFLEDQKNDVQANEIYHKLQRYMLSTDVDIQGLQTKLELGGYESILDMAKASKEAFAKQLLIHELSPAAQKIHAHLLAKAFTCFSLYVYPKIIGGMTKTQIMELVNEKIVKEIENCIGENVLDITNEEIMGMIFFLTGNCHIKWS